MSRLSKKKRDTSHAAPMMQTLESPSMTPEQMIAHLKTMGLAQVERSKVMETFRDAGQAEALAQANLYLASTNAAAARAKAAARLICGITA